VVCSATAAAAVGACGYNAAAAARSSSATRRRRGRIKARPSSRRAESAQRRGEAQRTSLCGIFRVRLGARGMRFFRCLFSGFRLVVCAFALARRRRGLVVHWLPALSRANRVLAPPAPPRVCSPSTAYAVSLRVWCVLVGCSLSLIRLLVRARRHLLRAAPLDPLLLLSSSSPSPSCSATVSHAHISRDALISLSQRAPLTKRCKSVPPTSLPMACRTTRCRMTTTTITTIITTPTSRTTHT